MPLFPDYCQLMFPYIHIYLEQKKKYIIMKTLHSQLQELQLSDVTY